MATNRSAYGRKPQSAPLGIKIICVLGALGALGSLLRGLGVLFSSPIGLIVGAIVIVFAVAKLAVVWGLWTLKSWAWTLTIIVYGLSLLMDVFRFFTGHLAAFFGIVVGGLLLAYVYSKREYYK
ncbi:hypothetical protein BG842_14780 [Haladaptatus sp. W1]|uniref:DUF2127 domain-containing protein n=1 Tax=Haladaptatus sp. W1 TaxID=1897478 RepID=UPI000849DC75|nr:DUF2127 domain-containing protein [Haladaptatus sp. W1]ODR83046.1 hypothetical protein BG842_14780 [Haladaptatus sp. W1]